MSSAQDITQALEAAIRARGGEAPAGVIVAEVVAQGLGGASTVRRVARDVVVRDRLGNTFLWRLPSPLPAQEIKFNRNAAQMTLEARGAVVDDNWTDSELEALVEDYDEAQIREMFGPPPGAAPFAPRRPAPKPRLPRQRRAW